jgi:hypothetical protein
MVVVHVHAVLKFVVHALLCHGVMRSACTAAGCRCQFCVYRHAPTGIPLWAPALCKAVHAVATLAASAFHYMGEPRLVVVAKWRLAAECRVCIGVLSWMTHTA